MTVQDRSSSVVLETADTRAKLFIYDRRKSAVERLRSDRVTFYVYYLDRQVAQRR